MCVSNYTMVKVLRWSKVWYHKLGFNHVVLFIIYFVYLLLGASLFYILEHESSVDFRAQWQTLIDIQRRHFVSTELLPDIFNNSRFLVFVHDQKSQRFIDIVQKRLVMYETKLRIRPPLPYLEWTFENSLAYCWSLITTIGYGYTYPVTDSGRVASVVYSIFGIPFTIVVIKDLAYLLARLLNYPNVLLGYIWNLFRYCTLQPVNEQELYKNLNAKRLKSDPDYRISLIRRLLNIPAIVAIFALIGWLSLGAFLFSKYETGISVSTSLYLLYNTLSTIGIGDVEPRKALTLTFMIPYVYVGLAIVSMFVNLLHAKFSRAYWLPEDNPLLKTEARMSFRGKIKGNTESPKSNAASFDSDLSLQDIDLNHYVTLGVLQAEDRRPLLAKIQKERGYRNVQTQTLVTLPIPKSVTLYQRDPNEASAIFLGQPTNSTSLDDVKLLMSETYSSQPPRIIGPCQNY